MIDNFDQLEWLAFSRGFRAYCEYLDDLLGDTNASQMCDQYILSGQCEVDYEEWRGRNYVNQVRQEVSDGPIQ